MHIHPYWLGCGWGRPEGAICSDEELVALSTPVLAESAVVQSVSEVLVDCAKCYPLACRYSMIQSLQNSSSQLCLWIRYQLKYQILKSH